jgi:hypothetical protein
MAIIYLDQNKWIELAGAVMGEPDGPMAALAKGLAGAVASGRILVPLTSANIYETHKINDPERRVRIASLQVALSKGRVFRTRRDRLRIEVASFLREVAGLPDFQLEEGWFLSKVFPDAFAPRETLALPQALAKLIGEQPELALFSYLTDTPDEVRRVAVRRMSDGLDRLRQRVESRRARDRDDPIGMRKRIYSASLLVEDGDLILSLAEESGTPWRSFGEMGGVIVRRLCREVPAYHTEVELAMKLEDQGRAITENDFRDMQAFSAAIPYAEAIIGEKQFVNLAVQCQLPQRYQTEVSTELETLWPYVTEPI